MSVAYESHVCTQVYCICRNTLIKVMTELNWRVFKFTTVLTSIGLFFTALCMLVSEVIGSKNSNVFQDIGQKKS